MSNLLIIGTLPPPVGGVTVHIERLIHHLKGTGVFEVNLIDTRRINLIKDIRKFLASDVVNVQLSRYYIVILIILFLFRKKVIYSVHSEYFYESVVSNSLRAFIFKNIVNCVLCDNKKIFENFETLQVGCKQVIPFLPPIDRDGFKFIDLCAIYGLKYKTTIVFNAYKLAINSKGEDVYGLSTLLESLNYINKKVNLLLLIPEITDQESRKILTTVNEFSDQLDFRLISDKKIKGWKYIASADIFVRPTITDGDALSIREAQLFGVPVIASDCTLRPKGVILFESRSAKDLASKINFVNENLEKIKKDVVENGQFYCLDDFVNVFKG